jgi:hypothetical protein
MKDKAAREVKQVILPKKSVLLDVIRDCPLDRPFALRPD